MEIIHRVNGTFNPPGLTEYIQEHSSDRISHAQQLITVIEDTIRDMTIAVLKNKHGQDYEDWWREGVPQSVRVKAAQKSETDQVGGQSPHKFLELIDYKVIAESTKNWPDFEKRFNVQGESGSKSLKIAWMDNLNGIRNRVYHSGRRSVTSEELSFLEQVWEHMEGQWELMKSQIVL